MAWGSDDRLRDHVQLRLVFDVSNVDLLEVAKGLTALSRLWGTAVQLDAYRQLVVTVPRRGKAVRPEVTQIVRGSLAVDLASGAAAEGGFGMSFWFFRWLVRNPDQIGAFIPGVVEGWHRGWTNAEIARRDKALAKAITNSRTDTEIVDPVARLARLAARDGKNLQSALGTPDITIRTIEGTNTGALVSELAPAPVREPLPRSD